MSTGSRKYRPPESRVADILSRVRISEAYHAATGIEPRFTGSHTWRAPATWRGGDGKDSVSGDDSRNVWRDFVSGEGGGVLDLVIQIRGGSRVDALRWLADFVGVQLDDTPLSTAERARWTRERAELESELPAAKLFQRAAISVCEESLDAMKEALFSGPYDAIDFDGIREMTIVLARLQRITGAELVTEFRSWRAAYPGTTDCMVMVARRRAQLERDALEEYLGIGNGKAVAA